MTSTHHAELTMAIKFNEEIADFHAQNPFPLFHASLIMVMQFYSTLKVGLSLLPCTLSESSSALPSPSTSPSASPSSAMSASSTSLPSPLPDIVRLIFSQMLHTYSQSRSLKLLFVMCVFIYPVVSLPNTFVRAHTGLIGIASYSNDCTLHHFPAVKLGRTRHRMRQGMSVPGLAPRTVRNVTCNP